MSHQHQGNAAPFGSIDAPGRHSPHLGQGAGKGLPIPHGLHAVHHHQGSSREEIHELLGITGGQKVQGRGLVVQPKGPRGHLLQGFLPRDVEDGPSSTGQGQAGLEQKGGLADPRLPRQQRHAPRSEAPPEHPIQFVHPRGDAVEEGNFRRPDGPGLGAPPGGLAPSRGRPEGEILFQRSPGATPGAFPCPGRRGGSTGGADKARFVLFRHERSSARGAVVSRRPRRRGVAAPILPQPPPHLKAPGFFVPSRGPSREFPGGVPRGDFPHRRGGCPTAPDPRGSGLGERSPEALRPTKGSPPPLRCRIMPPEGENLFPRIPFT